MIVVTYMPPPILYVLKREEHGTDYYINRVVKEHFSWGYHYSLEYIVRKTSDINKAIRYERTDACSIMNKVNNLLNPDDLNHLGWYAAEFKP